MPQTYFDNYASDYDIHFSDTLIGKAQRLCVHNYIKSFNLKDKVGLELNCGTGTDAVFLAAQCQEIVCTDISGAMVEITKTKTATLNNVSVIQSSIQEVQNTNSKRFNFVFSNFGGLNCLTKEELIILSDKSFSFTHLDSDLFFVIMSKKCLWERVYFTCKGSLKKASRRKQTNNMVTEKGDKFPVYYYSPGEITAMFSSNYKTVSCLPVGLFVPPSYLNPFFNKRPFLFSVLLKLDDVFSKTSWLSDYADHYIIHLKRK